MWTLKARDFVQKEYYVRLRYYDNKNEHDSLRTILALDADDAMSQVNAYALAEEMYWYDVSIPTPTELKAIRAKFDQQWREYRERKAKGLPPATGTTGLQPC